MTVPEIMAELEAYGNEQTKKTYLRHGCPEPVFGVKAQDYKKILKKTKKNHQLSIDLYATGNSDAMYLAGLMADEKQITKEDLMRWANEATWYYISEFAVPWVAAETPYGMELALKWIRSKNETLATCGWATLSSVAGFVHDNDLDLRTYSNLLDEVNETIHSAPNRLRHTMNAFVIAVGTYIESLTEKSLKVAKNVGKVSVNMGDTACKVPLANDYILKSVNANRIGKKRKSARC
ncbi:MAG: 3-methyladenine DNA glycosylase AlkD [Bacteroidia bacterium]|jgi:3-methyladenine DNA glycosylase AlkD